MGKASEESAFLRGDIGVDGQAVEEVKDEGELEQTKVMEELVRGRTYLGREFLTWLLWRTNDAASLVTIDNSPSRWCWWAVWSCAAWRARPPSSTSRA